MRYQSQMRDSRQRAMRWRSCITHKWENLTAWLRDKATNTLLINGVQRYATARIAP